MHKTISLAVAYCDNDTKVVRENFIRSVFVSGEDMNHGWINVGIFETLILE